MSNNVCLAFSSIITAFDHPTIGTKIVDSIGFLNFVHDAISNHNFSSDRIPGQGLIDVPEVIPFISGGVGRARNNPGDYILRSHRGKVHAYLKREFAEPVIGCRVVVYTKEVYLADPDLDEVEAKNIREYYCTHVMVAILGESGVRSTLSPYRFVKNLAGGNREVLVWSGDENRAKACEIAYNVDGWSIVAD